MSSLSVCVPCYNYARYLPMAVLPILRSGVSDLEILILDDCSPDDTPEVARRLQHLDSRISYRRHEKNQGHIATYNEGIEWAGREYFLLLSADDMVLARHLCPRLRFLDEHPEVVFSYAPMFLFYTDRSRGHKEVPPGHEGYGTTILSGERFLRLSLESRVCLPPYLSTIVRTSAQKQAGGFDPEHPIAGDLQMWLRLGCLGDVGYHPFVAGLYRRHSRNMSQVSTFNLPYLNHRVFRGMMPRIAARHPGLAEVWKASQRHWVNDLYTAAGSARQASRQDEAAMLFEYARSLGGGPATWPLSLRLRLRSWIGEERWARLRRRFARAGRASSEEGSPQASRVSTPGAG